MLFYVTAAGIAFVYKLQDKTEYGLKKTTLISSVSHFNLWVETLFEWLSLKKSSGDDAEFWPPVLLGGKLADISLIRIIAYSSKTYTKILSNWLCD